jgi:hypothetical protein
MVVAKISADGSRLIASTFVGGRLGEGAEGIGVDAQDNVIISGATYSDNFPVTADGYQTRKSGASDAVAVKLSGDFSQLLYGSFLGGSSEDFGRASTTDAAGNIFLAGETGSNNWPTANAFQSNFGSKGDGLVAKIIVSGQATPGNQPPVVDAGPDKNISISQSVLLDGTITDDGIPTPPGKVTSRWSMESGPGNVAFSNPVLPDTQANFSQSGMYTLRLTASDGEFSRSDLVSVVVVGTTGDGPGVYIPFLVKK